MKFKEPQHTISWTAWHIFDKLFYAKYESGKLTINEYCSLINTVVARRAAHVAKNRKWYQLRLRWRDRVFLNKCRNLMKALEPGKQPKIQKRGVDFSDTNSLIKKVTETVKTTL